MDSKAIAEKSKALVKATSAGEAPSIIIDILNELKNGVVASEDLLRSTRIGVAVNKSANHSNPEVKKLASEIVRKWRNDVSKQKAGANNGKGGKVSNGNHANGTSSPAPEIKKATSSPSVPLEQRTWKTDDVDINKTGQASRNNCIGLIYNGLAPNSKDSAAVVLASAVAVEMACYTTHGPEDKSTYKDKIRSLYQNLKAKTNPSLRVQVLNGSITPSKFVIMSHDELKSPERREQDRILEKENMRDAQVPKAEKSISTSLTCGKCGQKKVSYSQAQTRSADEPMTTFCECLNCGKRWKFS
ncbi:RNA polymerase II elongation factor [Bachmanniomyces sp. S44760]|nr:RNA polymerase II elongation factor [Bachmanniomyces sp. S44760]